MTKKKKVIKVKAEDFRPRANFSDETIPIGVCIRQYSIGTIDESTSAAEFLRQQLARGWEITSSCASGPNLITYTLVKRG